MFIDEVRKRHQLLEPSIIQVMSADLDGDEAMTGDSPQVSQVRPRPLAQGWPSGDCVCNFGWLTRLKTNCTEEIEAAEARISSQSSETRDARQ